MSEMKKCSKCKKELPGTTDYFHRWKHSKDGFRSACKECRGGHYGVTQPNKVYEYKEGYQYCSKCRKLLPASKEYFKTDKRRASGYGSDCKVCSGTSSYGVHLVRIQQITQEGFKHCNKCLRELPSTADYFYSDKRSRSGFSSHCKECKGQSFGETKFNPHVIDIARKGYYICRCCKKELPLDGDYFTKLVASPTGYNCYCKECSRNKEKNSNNKNIENHRSKAVIKSQKRRTLKKGLPSTFTKEEWIKCKKYFRSQCAYCGKKLPLAQDHFLSLSHGGSYDQSNIIAACQYCNSSKNNKSFFSWYPKFEHYSFEREAKILSYLGYVNGVQQLSFT